jgi:imidazolonepropionase-like amidohydrolase|tara:strand:- start:9292 stop:10533 length:1242 start_codon:yes stop_codon:yes gene_type:complete
MMLRTLFYNVQVWDASREFVEDGMHILVEGDRIKEISDKPLKVSEVHKINGKGKTIIPGLIDCHCHVAMTSLDLRELQEMPLTLMTVKASKIMRDMLMRGFTSIRDMAGADWGLAEAVERKLLVGPKIFFSGRALSQTGGHGDSRLRTHVGLDPCACSNGLNFTSIIADGISEVRRAAREELRKGANQIKVMVSGGVSSPYDPIDNKQYSEEELIAIVEEANSWNTYVAAHSYTSQSTQHAIKCGVRTIEHGNLIDKKTAIMMASKNVYLVPTLITYDALDRYGEELGLPQVSIEKLQRVKNHGKEAISLCREAGVKVGFGTDLLGALQSEQSAGLRIQNEVDSTRDVLVSATSVNAQILNKENELGIVAVGAKADLLLVNGNPLDDLSLLFNPDETLDIIMKDGYIYKNSLD